MIENIAHEIAQLTHAVHGLTHALSDPKTNAILNRIDQLERNIMATQIELTTRLNAVLAEQQKTAAEIASVQSSVDTLNAKIVKLQAIIDAGGTGAVTPELATAVDAVEAQAKVVDELIPDVTVPAARK